MYAKRNTITVGILLALLLIIGLFWNSRESKKINKLKEKNIELRKQLDGSLEIIQALEAVESEHRVLTEKWNHASKQIIAAEEPSFSLHYLNWIVNKYQIPLEFDFELKNIKNNGDILTFSFLISGEGSYHDLYRLIWFITENPILYKIESFSLKKTRDHDNLLDFSIQIEGFSLVQKLGSGQEFSFDTMKPVVERIQFHDAFKSLYPIQKPTPRSTFVRREIPKVKPKPIDPALIDIERATLQAVANGRAYVKDNKGKLITMKVGDKVRFGILRSINQTKSEIEFVLDKDGSSKTVILAQN